jgi:hypothetical protein
MGVLDNYYAALDRGEQDRATDYSRRAGRSLTGGDVSGAANALYQGGYLNAGQNLQKNAADVAQAQQQTADLKRKAELEGTLAIAGGLDQLLTQGVDPQKAWQMARDYAPMRGIDPAHMDQLKAYYDQNPKAFVGMVGQRAKKELEFAKGSDGSYTAIDPYTGRPVVEYRAPQADKFEQIDPEKDLYVRKGSPGGIIGGGLNPQMTGPSSPQAYGTPGFNPDAPPPRGAAASNYTAQDRDALARMIATEAGGEGPQGMLAAGAVAINRLKSGYGGAKTLSDVVTAPNQFEGMSRAGQVSPQSYQAALQVADQLLSGQAQDPTSGAIHFINPQLQAQLGRQQPAWAPAGQGQRIGNHVFYGGQAPAQNQLQGGAGSDVVMTSNPGAPEGLQLVRRGQPKPAASKGMTRPATAEEKAAYGIPADVPAQMKADGTLDVISGVSARNKQPPAAIQKGYADNGASIRQIDEAIAALKQNPDAMGFKNALGDPVMQRLDPGGIETRAAVANIGSLVIHDRSGAAVTAAETPRLKPFIPMPTDTAEAAIKKLRGLRRQYENNNSQIEVQYGEDSGYAPIGGRGQPPRTATPAPAASSASRPAASGGLPSQARAQLKAGHVTTFANGQAWTLQNGQPKRVK